MMLHSHNVIRYTVYFTVSNASEKQFFSYSESIILEYVRTAWPFFKENIYDNNCTESVHSLQKCETFLLLSEQIRQLDFLKSPELVGSFLPLLQAAVPGVFKPTPLTTENILLIINDYKSPVEYAAINGLNEASIVIFEKEYPGYPVNEMVAILMPKEEQTRQNIHTSQREMNMKNVFQMHKTSWDKAHSNVSVTYEFDVQTLYNIPGADEILGLGIDFSKELSILNTENRLYQKENPDVTYQLKGDLGMDYIESLYETNHYGVQLLPYLSIMLKLMKFSTVQGNLRGSFEVLYDFFPSMYKFQKYFDEERAGFLPPDNYHFVRDNSDRIVDLSKLTTRDINKLDLDWISADENDISRLEMILTCSLGPLNIACREKFSHVLTNRGICSAFNSLSLSKIFKPMPLLDTFSSIYEANGESPMNLPDALQYKRMFWVLDTHKSDILDSERGSFYLSIVDPYNHMEMRHEGVIKINPGERTRIKVWSVSKPQRDNG